MEKQNVFIEKAEDIIQECEEQIKDLENIVNADRIKKEKIQKDN